MTVKTTQVMSDEVVLNFINEAGKEDHHPKVKQCFIEVAIDTAMRLQHILEIDLDTLVEHDDFFEFEVVGRRGIEHTERINHEMYNKLIELKSEGYGSKVFAELNRESVNKMMTRISCNLGYEKNQYTFQSFKKTGLSNLFRGLSDSEKKERMEEYKVTMQEFLESRFNHS